MPEAYEAFMLLASYAFYGFWNWTYLPLLFGISVFAAVIARRIQRSYSPRARKTWLVVGVTGCLAILAYLLSTDQPPRALGLGRAAAADSDHFSAPPAGHFVFCVSRDLAAGGLLSPRDQAASAG